MKYSEAVLPDRPIIRGNPLACLVVCVWRRLLVLITVQKVLVSFGEFRWCRSFSSFPKLG